MTNLSDIMQHRDMDDVDIYYSCPVAIIVLQVRVCICSFQTA